MYERSDGYYEVFIVKEAPAEYKFGKDYPDRERYPSNEEVNFCCITRERADKKV